ncbi:MerR family transcriptional regulator [Sphingomonas sp. ASY06-1R]|uniref:MerR family transcriptional regulator n=1 Tax=Sphingomonas sp. ASY06-1R TaxID=3445771 RepID=UPI003FA25688
MAEPSAKAEGAFRTISEVASELGLPQHILRYWETRFPQLRPLQRAGNRRYYRPADVALARRIDRLLNHEGYTMRGVQKLLAQPDGGAAAVAAEPAPRVEAPTVAAPDSDSKDQLIEIREALSRALATDIPPQS